jgi:putative ABC transport system substrate-binding protein
MFATGIALFATPAYPGSPPYRIGVLIPPLAASPLEEGLRQGLRELGYTEGKDIIVEWRRSTTGAEEELRLLATDLASSRVQLIVASGGLAARVALTATKLPVVFAPVGDPVESGLATSLARPGGNGTGVSIVASQLIGKRLEVLRALVPQARRIVYLGNSSAPLAAGLLEATKKAAQTLRVKLIILDARNADELDAALRAIPKSGADGAVVAGDFLFVANKAKVAEAVRKAKLPAMFPVKEYHDNGALMSYGPNLTEAMRRAAVYVDKILNGANPSDLPIEQISQFELIIDLRVARALKLKVPDALLLRADEVIQ